MLGLLLYGWFSAPSSCDDGPDCALCVLPSALALAKRPRSVREIVYTPAYSADPRLLGSGGGSIDSGDGDDSPATVAGDLGSNAGGDSGTGAAGDSRNGAAGDSGAAPGGASGASGGSGGAHNDHETLFFLFSSVSVGTVILHLTTVPALHSLQFTVVIFFLGILFSMSVHAGALDSVAFFSRSYFNWMNIEPHLLLFTFLPALLCGDAMTIDTFVARRCCRQVFLLAGPGVVIGSFSTAAVLYYVLPYGWTGPTCLAVGSILSATDPVAVVGLLKELGASPMLTLLIQGESLLNDGTAMVLFTIAYEMTSGTVYTAEAIMAMVVRSIFGAAIVGTAVGFVCYCWIACASDKVNHRNPMIQIIVSIGCAYWSFLLAEGVLHVSGVLSTVFAALVLAHKMWPVLCERGSMLEIWHVIETVGNTLVFFLGGALTGKASLHIKTADFGWALMVYGAINAIRLVMMLIFLPLLRLAGPPVTIKEILVMTWGGLRGLVGLSLGILVEKDRAAGSLSETDADRILFLVGSVAAMTLMVNATTAPALCRALGILQAPEGRNVLIRNVAKRAINHLDSLIIEVEQTRSPQQVSIPVVKQLMHELFKAVNDHLPQRSRVSAAFATLQKSMSKLSSFSGGSHPLSLYSSGSDKAAIPDVDALWQRFESGKWELCKMGVQISAFQFGGQLDSIKQVLSEHPIDPRQLKVVREVFLDAVRVQYWEQVQNGRFVVGSPEPGLLLNSVNIAKEWSGSALQDWYVLEDAIRFQPMVQEATQENHRKISMATTVEFGDNAFGNDGMGTRCTRMVRSWLRDQLKKKHFSMQTRAIQIVSAFIDAHYQVQSQIASFFGEDAGIDSPEEAYVVIESQVEVFAAAAFRGLIDMKVQKKVNTMWEVHRLAEQFRHFILQVHNNGVLNAREAEVLLAPLGRKMAKLDKERRIFGTNGFVGDAVDESPLPGHKYNRYDAAMVIQKQWRVYLAKKEAQRRRREKTLTLELEARSRQVSEDRRAQPMLGIASQEALIPLPLPQPYQQSVPTMQQQHPTQPPPLPPPLTPPDNGGFRQTSCEAPAIIFNDEKRPLLEAESTPLQESHEPSALFPPAPSHASLGGSMWQSQLLPAGHALVGPLPARTLPQSAVPNGFAAVPGASTMQLNPSAVAAAAQHLSSSMSTDGSSTSQHATAALLASAAAGKAAEAVLTRMPPHPSTFRRHPDAMSAAAELFPVGPARELLRAPAAPIDMTCASADSTAALREAAAAGKTAAPVVFMPNAGSSKPVVQAASEMNPSHWIDKTSKWVDMVFGDVDEPAEVPLAPKQLPKGMRSASASTVAPEDGVPGVARPGAGAGPEEDPSLGA